MRCVSKQIKKHQELRHTINDSYISGGKSVNWVIN